MAFDGGKEDIERTQQNAGRARCKKGLDEGAKVNCIRITSLSSVWYLIRVAMGNYIKYFLLNGIKRTLIGKPAFRSIINTEERIVQSQLF